MRARTHAPARAHTHTHTRARPHTHTHKHARAHTHTNTRAHAHAHTHTHTRTRARTHSHPPTATRANQLRLRLTQSSGNSYAGTVTSCMTDCHACTGALFSPLPGSVSRVPVRAYGWMPRILLSPHVAGLGWAQVPPLGQLPPLCTSTGTAAIGLTSNPLTLWSDRWEDVPFGHGGSSEFCMVRLSRS